ncbi:MAG: cell division protein FtsL [Acidobacteria bacterium]|nr:cell division protein FtsL [Acidobacteriota bacterium]
MTGIYYIKPVDNSRWTPAPNPREPQYYALLLMAGAVLLGAGMFFARERFQGREYGYQIERMEREMATMVEANRKLRLEEASLVDPLRIDSIARNELGMTTLSPQQIYRDAPVPVGATVVAAQRSPGGFLALQSRSVAAALP